MRKRTPQNPDLHGNVPDHCPVALSYLECRTIILVGLTTNACVLTTACEIHVRDLDLFVPSDCVASPDAKQHSIALELMRKSFGARIRRSKGIDLRQVTKT
jgi:nicotinamidase-related amidase